MTKTQKTSFASLRPSDAVQGGLIADVDVTIKRAQFVMFDYQGKAEPQLAMQWDMQDDDGGVHEHFATLGKAATENFAPSDDGYHLVPTGEKTTLNKGSNFMLLIESLVAAGYPESRLDDGLSAMEGMRVHIVRVPAPKRPGIINQPGQEGREKTVLQVTEVTLPEEKKAAGKGKAAGAGAGSTTGAPTKGKAAAKPAAQEAEDEGEGSELATELQGIVLGILGDKGEVKKTGLAPLAFKALQGNPNKAELLKLLANEDFYTQGAEAGLWSYTKGTLSAAE